MVSYFIYCLLTQCFCTCRTSKDGSFFPITFPKEGGGRGATEEKQVCKENKMLLFKSNICFSTLGFWSGKHPSNWQLNTESWSLSVVAQIVSVLHNQDLRWNCGKAHAVSVLSETLQSVCSIAVAFNPLLGIHNWVISVALEWAQTDTGLITHS